MTRPYPPNSAWSQAAQCYEQAGQYGNAGRCYANAGNFSLAARAYRADGNLRAAARMENEAGRHTFAAWTYVHELGDLDAARMSLRLPDTRRDWTEDGSTIDLRRRLVETRCALAEDAPADIVLPVLTDVQNHLVAMAALVVRVAALQDWAIAVAEAAKRFDQVALTFAAAVRGGDPAAAERWRRWALDRYGQTIVIPRAAG
ncbi:hypothetical protein [Actinoplanes aureus]|uniref:Uncharacterized protein n=1 Tax=Actinoplanes aureus TaxID=2792083 RepID=A0A931C9K1_9ACTN|nr:hypothetical protein [Actinoplanes aureus]MBG0562556.1 hypothetical protein [Actinoplanes aureus]